MVEAGIEIFTTGPQIRAPHVLSRIELQTRPISQILDALISGDALPGDLRGVSRGVALAEVIETYGKNGGPEVSATLTPDVGTRRVSEWIGAAASALAETSGTPQAQDRITRAVTHTLSQVDPWVRDSAARQIINGLERTQKRQDTSTTAMQLNVATQLAAVMGVPLKRPPAEITITIPEVRDVQLLAAAAAIAGMTSMGIAVPARAETPQPPIAAATTEATETTSKAGGVEIVVVPSQTVTTPSSAPTSESSPSTSPTTDPTQPTATASGTPTPTETPSQEPSSSPTQPPTEQQPSTDPTTPPTNEQTPVTLPTAPPTIPEQKGDTVPAVEQAMQDPASFAEALNNQLPAYAEKQVVPETGSVPATRADAVLLTTPLPKLAEGDMVDVKSIVGANPLMQNLLRGESSEPTLIQATKPNSQPRSQNTATEFSRALSKLSTEGLPQNPLRARLDKIASASNQDNSGNENISDASKSTLRIQAMVDNGVPNRYAKYYEEFGQKYNISPFILAAQGGGESSYKVGAISYKGAGGISQFMPATWKHWKKILHFPALASRFMPRYAIEAQAAMMADLHDTAEKSGFPGDPMQLALAGYNAGWGKVKKAGGQPSYNVHYSTHIIAGAKKMQAIFNKAAGGAQSNAAAPNTANQGDAELLKSLDNQSIANFVQDRMPIPMQYDISVHDAQAISQYLGAKYIGEVKGYIKGKEYPFLAAKLPDQYTLNGNVKTSIYALPAFVGIYSELHDTYNLKHIVAGVGFRTNAEQIRARIVNKCRDIFKASANSCETPTARPGESEHQSPRAAMDTYNKRTKNFLHSGNEKNHPAKDPEFDTVNMVMNKHGMTNLRTEGWHDSETGH